MMEDRALGTFLDLVRIDSPSGSESAVAQYCAEELRAMGLRVWFDDSKGRTGSDTGNLFAENRPGSDPTLVLSAHMDCVDPCVGVEPVVDDGIVTSAGETVLGADDKAGIAAILTAVRRLVESNGDTPRILVVLTVSEEIGLVGAKALDVAELAGDLCLVLDADGEPGGMVIGAPTHYTFKATFLGKASHAGVAPQDGVSAVVMASKAIAAMEIGRLDEGTTANIGSIGGGTATNVVPAEVLVTGECRSLDVSRVEQAKSSMDSAMRRAAKDAGGDVDIEWTREYEGFNSPDDSDAVKIVADACSRIGLEAKTFKTGGGSDGNIFAAAGIPTLVLSCGMKNVHSVNERISVEHLHSLTDLVVETAFSLVRS